MISEAVKALAETLKATEVVALPMNQDKQANLKSMTDKTPDLADDNAYLAACAFYSTCLVLETLSGKDIDIEAAYLACVKAGAIRKEDAMIFSYEKIAETVGVKVKRFDALYIKGNEAKLLEQLRNKNPLVMFLGAPDLLNHVEAAHGFIAAKDETLVFLKDPGWQNDTHFQLADRRTFHFQGTARKYSRIDHGPLANTDRKAYKFGFFVV